MLTKSRPLGSELSLKMGLLLHAQRVHRRRKVGASSKDKELFPPSARRKSCPTKLGMVPPPWEGEPPAEPNGSPAAQASRQRHLTGVDFVPHRAGAGWSRGSPLWEGEAPAEP